MVNKKSEFLCFTPKEGRQHRNSLERKTRLERATLTLARLCSTNWAISAESEVKRRRLELPRRNWHYPLKVARLPIPPPLQHIKAFWITRAQNRTRTCTHRCTRTWNVRVYQFRHLGIWIWFIQNVERKTGLGPATPTLARLCSTNWAISAFTLPLNF